MRTKERIGLSLVGGGALGLLGFLLYGLNQKAKKPKAMLPATSGTKQNFIKLMRDAIGTQIPEPGRVLAIAWAAFESDWGRDTAFAKANNPWNITAGSAWKGETVPGPDTQYNPDGSVINITQAWRKYGSLADAVGDMISFLSNLNTNYRAARDALFAGDIGFTDKLYAGKYFTLPPDKYKAGVQTMLNEVKGLGVV